MSMTQQSAELIDHIFEINKFLEQIRLLLIVIGVEHGAACCFHYLFELFFNEGELQFSGFKGILELAVARLIDGVTKLTRQVERLHGREKVKRTNAIAFFKVKRLLFHPQGDAASAQVIGREFNGHRITHQEMNLAGDQPATGSAQTQMTCRFC